jgi:hypothetical protein
MCPQFEVPCLDGLEQGSLSVLNFVFSTLAEYCEHKEMAMMHRLQGNVDTACHYERQADAMYQNLPKEYRW